MRRDITWRDILTALERLKQEVKDLRMSVDRLTAESDPVPLPPRPVRLAKILRLIRPAFRQKYSGGGEI